MLDVAIIGLGPVGATLANLLGKLGLSVVAFDRATEIFPLPRAVHFDGETMRVFQEAGITPQLLDYCHVSPGMKFVDPGGKLLVDWPRPMEVGSQGWHPSYRFHQPDLERLLRERLRDRPGVQVKLGCDVYAVDEHDTHLTLRYEDVASGGLASLDARFVVGCDGARSLVRRLIGSELEDLGLHEKWLVFDAILKGSWSRSLGDFSIQFCNPQRPATYVRGVGNRRRWEIMLMPGDNVAEISRTENIWPLVESWISPDEADIERGAVYTFHSVIAQQWRKGRMLLAGDAAHQTPPFLGQGMCAGIRDAANLAWKLQAVVSGRCASSLLDTYQAERHPHVDEYIRLAVRLGRLIQATGDAQVRERDQQFAQGPELMRSITPVLGASALNDGQGGAGTLSWQPLLRDGSYMDDKVGMNFYVVARPGLIDDELKVVCAASAVKPVLVPADEPAIADWLDALGAGMVAVRPDRYLLGTANTPQELQGLWARLAHVVA